MPVSPQPAPDDNGPSDSPEALFISSLIETGDFVPDKFHIKEDDLYCWQSLFRFCTDHQQLSGKAPARSLLKTKYPDFEIHPAIDPRWAADQLHRKASENRLRRNVANAVQLLNEGEVEKAYDTVAGLHRPRVIAKPAVNIFDQVDESDFAVSKLPVPFTALSRVTGGIAPGEFWLLGGRQGTGKTQLSCHYIAGMVKDGYSVRYLSCEMPAAEIAHIVQRNLARDDKKILKLLDSGDWRDKKKAVDLLRGKVAGSLDVLDPSHGRITNATIRSQQDEGPDLVVVDHIGLVHTNDGRRAIDDWRAMALISNTTKEDCLATHVPVLAAVQLNRQAEHGGMKPPKMSEIGGSDALGQDCDKGILMRRLSTSVMVHGAQKVRGGRNATWYTRYDPSTLDYREISKEVAMDQMNMDDDIAADM